MMRTCSLVGIGAPVVVVVVVVVVVIGWSVITGAGLTSADGICSAGDFSPELGQKYILKRCNPVRLGSRQSIKLREQNRNENNLI